MRTLIALLALSFPAFAQFGELPMATKFADVGAIDAMISPTSAKPGEVVTITFTVTPQPGCTTYPVSAATGQTNLTKFILDPKSDLILVAVPVDPQGVKEKEGGTKGSKEKYYDIPVTWTLKAIVSPKASAGKKSIKFDSSFVQACSNSCFKASADDFPVLDYTVQAGSVPVPPEYAGVVDAVLNPPKRDVPTVTPPASKPVEHHSLKKTAMPIDEYKAKLDALNASLVKTPVNVANDLTGLLSAAVFWGWISLVTPCVFPMIPITVSLFLKKSNQSTGSAVKLATVYSLTIIVVLGLSAVLLLSVFRKWSVSTEMNLFLGVLFVVFALSLFGMYDIQLPGSLLRATEKRRAAGGLLGTVFGAFAFSIVSFTCVAPFLGGFAGIAATGNFSNFELVLAGLAFATAFASPFFLLALFPSLLKKLPKSGGWLDTVKAVMGFLELAAAMKFFRTAEIRRPPVEYFTYDVVLAAWVVILFLCGIYLMGFFRLPHDDDEKKHVPVPRLVFAMLFLGLGVYLLPGLFKTADGKPQRPNGVVFAWVDSFLLPEAMPTTGDGNELPWSTDLFTAIDNARKERLKTGLPKYVFVDFTGVTCTNCKYNEANIFPLPNIHESLMTFNLVQMYTDDVPGEFYAVPPPQAELHAEALANLSFQKKAFGTEQLPLYVILEPLANGQVRVVDVYAEGKINTKDKFAAFLKR
ncbi:hypothetical protein BH11PLA2_BH11PLA2_47970 [soil metagenome]